MTSQMKWDQRFLDHARHVASWSKDPSMMAKGRDGHGILLGESNPTAKLTEDAIREIRRLRLDGWKLREIAAMFGVTETNVSYIVRRKVWKHVK